MNLARYQKRVREAKREAIVDAAREIFLRVGYARATVDSIAGEAGVSLATLYKHFSTKAELFGAVMQLVWAKWIAPEALPAETLGTREGLRRIGSDYAALLAQPIMVPLFRVLIAEVESFPELGLQLYEHGKKPWLDLVESFLKREKRARRLHFKDAALATRQFAGMINDVLFWPQFLIKDLPFDAKQVEHVVDEAVETFMARYASSRTGDGVES